MELIEQTRADFDQIALLPSKRWTSNNHYYSFLLRHIPNTTHRILDVGCGKGDFCRLLSTKAQEVIGIDISGGMIHEAERKSVLYNNLSFYPADYLQTPYPQNHFDVITVIATVHHFSLSHFLIKAKRELKKDGLLIVLDLYEPQMTVDFLYSVVAVPISMCYRLCYNRQIRASLFERNLWAKHGKHDQYDSLKLLRSIYDEHLEEFEFRRHLFWRYSMIWKK